ncbi:acyl-CoA dehydrogenase family protein [Nocardioides sediminis]|uniref:acyl-CoA dehydrogenase family protein n=1 Tax=Nocardioides sediminis TaxID=433648 RepID=UPI00131F1FB7|nr:acyl-CoA dehydrogenase family protein [Nocardioides sediminis]
MDTEVEKELDELRGLVVDVLGDATTTEEAWQRLAASDLTLVSVPDEHGGSGGSLVEAAAVLGATAEAGFSLPLVETAWLAGWLAAAAGRAAPDAATTFEVVEDVDVAKGADGRHLTGTVDGVAWWDHVSEVHLVLPAHGAVAVLRTDPGSAGAAPVALPRGTVTVDHVVPDSDWYALPAPAAEVVAELELRAALGRAVQIAGACRSALELSVRYSTERVQFGRPLSANQVIQHYLARMASQAHGIAVATRAAVEAYAVAGPAAAAEVHSAKAVASVGVEEVTSLAHQVHGAIGTTLEHPLHRRTMSLWSWRDDAGDEFEHAIALAGTETTQDLWNHLVPTGAVR